MPDPIDDSGCPACGARHYTPSYCGLCGPCVARIVREHPERRLIVDGHAIRYVIPSEHPERRPPQPRDPDDITTPQEHAEHRGLPDPELTFYWRQALERIHADHPEVFEDENGHLFGPIERMPVVVLRTENSELADWPPTREQRFIDRSC